MYGNRIAPEGRKCRPRILTADEEIPGVKESHELRDLLLEILDAGNGPDRTP